MEAIRKTQQSPDFYQGPIGKIRDPIGVVLLTISTLFIYSTYWGYAASNELKEHCPEANVHPVLYAILLSPLGLAFLLIPSWFALYYMGKELRDIQMSCSCPEAIDPAKEIAAPIGTAGGILLLSVFLLPIFGILLLPVSLIIEFIYFFVFLAKVQRHLNLHWHMHLGEIAEARGIPKETWVMHSQSWVAHCDLSEQELALKKFVEEHQMMVMNRTSDDRSLELRLLQGSPIRTQFLGGLLTRPEQLYKRAAVKLEINDQCVEVNANIEDDFGFWALPSPVRRKYEAYFDLWMEDLRKAVS